MKLQILTLDSTDDLASVRDKLNWVQAQRVVLVWPSSGRVLTRQLDLVLLQRLAAGRGFQLGLVSFDPDVQQNAKHLGIPQFNSVDDIDNSKWRVPRGSKFRQRVSLKPPKAKSDLQKPPSVNESTRGTIGNVGRVLIFVLALSALVALSAAILPSADIYLKPERFNQTTWITLKLDPSQDQESTKGFLAVQSVSMPVSGERRILTSGFSSSPDGLAKGVVVFTNLQSETVTIPIGTGVRSSQAEDLRFETAKMAELGAELGATVYVPIEAVQPGQKGNLDAGMIDSVEGELGLSTRVTNPESLEGGTSTIKPAVAQKDLDRLSELLREELTDRAEAEIIHTLRDDQRLIHQSLNVEEEIQLLFDHDAGDLAESVGLHQDMSVSGWIYNTTDLEEVLQSIASDRLPVDSLVIPRTFRIIEIEEFTIPSTTHPSLRIRVQQQWIKAVPESEIIQDILGVSVEHFEKIILEELGSANEVSINLRPHWFPIIPVLSSRITITLEGID